MKVVDFRIFALLAAMFVPILATAGTTGTEFLALYTWVNGVATGYGGRLISIAAFLVGAMMSVAKGNPIPLLVGIAFAIFMQYIPTIINGILTATI